MPTYPTYKLGDVAEIISGKNQKEVVSPQGKYPIYGSGGIIGWATDYLCKENSTIIGRKGTIDSPIFVNRKFWNVDTAFGIQPSEKVLPRYLFFFCKSFDFKKLDKSTTIPSLAKRDLLQIPIPLPPLPTQRLIVSRIESLFAELDKAVQHLRTAQQQLKTYRQAVLKVAFEGCENAEKHLFGELMADVRNGYGAKPTDCGTNKLLRISSVRAMSLNLDDFRFNNSSFDERDIIQENDLLFTRYNGSVDLVGVCAYVPELYDTYAYPDKIIRCRPKVCNTFHSKFLQYYINQGKVREFVRSKIKTTSGQNGISGSDIKKIEIPLPTLTEQQRIVNEIELRLSQATASETYIENALQQAEALRQSILKKAFSGELV